MTDPDAITAIEHFRVGFQLLVEVDKRVPGETDAVVEAFVAHVKAFRPAIVSEVLNRVGGSSEPTP